MRIPWKKKDREALLQGGKRSALFSAKVGLAAICVFCIAALIWQGSAERAVQEVQQGELPEPALPVTAVPAKEEITPESMFAGYRLDRDEARDAELALLQTIIQDESGSPAIRTEAEQRRLAIAAAIENEVRAESLLAARGFGETVVLQGAERATVVCNLELTDAEATRIAEVVADACGIGFENVVIVNR